MIRPGMFRYLVLFILCGFLSSPVFAETIELVTYYPSSSTQGDLHARSITVGTPYQNVALGDGEEIVFERLGIGPGFDTSVPAGPLHVVGADNTADRILFMPGGNAGTLSVGVGTLNPNQAAMEIRGLPNAAGWVALAVTESTNNPLNEPALLLRRYRGTDAAPAAVANGDPLGAIQYEGYDGANLFPAARILSGVDAAPGVGDMPGRLVFQTTPDGTAAPVERMRITNAGNVGIGTAAPAASAALDVSSPTNNKGFLAPRMTTAQRIGIVGPADGLLIYNTDTHLYNAYDAATSSWNSLGGGGNSLGSIARAVRVAVAAGVSAAIAPPLPAGTKIQNATLLFIGTAWPIADYFVVDQFVYINHTITLSADRRSFTIGFLKQNGANYSTLSGNYVMYYSVSYA